MRPSSIFFLLAFFVLNPNFSFADQNEISHYFKARRIFWDLNSDIKSSTLYCDKSFKSKKGLNIEHVFAASWMKEASGCEKLNRKKCRHESKRFNYMESDLHNLYPTISELNSIRADLPFKILEGSSNDSCDFEFERHGVEPAPQSRGQIARALLYMSNEYQVDLDKASSSPGLTDLMKSWHCSYPVSKYEVIRNEKIYDLQKTINPYVANQIELDCLNQKKYLED